MRRHEIMATPRNHEYYKNHYEKLEKEGVLLGKKIEATSFDNGHDEFGSVLYWDEKKIYESLEYHDAEKVLVALTETQTDPSGLTEEQLENLTLDYKENIEREKDILREKKKQEKKEIEIEEIKPIFDKIVNVLSPEEMKRLLNDLPETWNDINKS